MPKNIDLTQDYYAMVKDFAKKHYAIDLNISQYANHYGSVAQRKIGEACDQVTQAHRKAMNTSNVKQKIAEKNRYDKIREVLHVLRSHDARQEYDTGRQQTQVQVTKREEKSTEKAQVGVKRHLLFSNSQQGAQASKRARVSDLHGSGQIANQKEIEAQLRAENHAYAEYLSYIQETLLDYRTHLKDHRPSKHIKDELYQQKLDIVDRLLRCMDKIDMLEEFSVRDRNFQYESITMILLTNLINSPSRPTSPEFKDKSAAEILGGTRTKLNFRDTGEAVLKGIVTALSYITVLPALLTKLITKKSVEAHLFKVTGGAVVKEINQHLKILNRARENIAETTRTHRYSGPRRGA